MDRDVRWALCQGNFEPGAVEQWDAISQALDGAGLDFNAINRVIGYSLGAHVAAAIARTAPEGIGLIYGKQLVLVRIIKTAWLVSVNLLAISCSTAATNVQRYYK